jgi:hypothetical protein
MPKGHAVVDGSNIATEGRNEPSLAQLRDAVAEFEAENDFKFVTVVVDASFEHRVSAREKKAARTAIDNGEMITPPAGVVGRGDTFILEVADRATAVVLSNDSFQEFHGTYDWLFDEGRLIGGKPVPGVGWIYVPRTPVRGPVSRRARKSTSSAKKPAAAPSPKRTARAKKPETSGPRPSIGATKKVPPVPPSDAMVDANTKTTWEAFRRDHRVGSKVKATVERFSSHGAYGTSHRAVVYFPNRILGNPAPNRARDAVVIGASRRFIVHRFAGIDFLLLDCGQD